MNKQIARKRRGVKTKFVIKNSGKPRLVIFKSARHTYAQILVSQQNGDRVLASSSTLDKELKPSLNGNKCEQAMAVGKLLGERAKKVDTKDPAVDILSLAFDRSGYKYHGRVKALADGAREAGLKF